MPNKDLPKDKVYCRDCYFDKKCKDGMIDRERYNKDNNCNGFRPSLLFRLKSWIKKMVKSYCDTAKHMANLRGKSQHFYKERTLKELKDKVISYVNGFKLGYGLGFVAGQVKAFAEIHLMRSMLFVLLFGMTVGYAIGRTVAAFL